MRDELAHTPFPIEPVPGSALPEHAARVFANALDLAEQALAHHDVAMASDALEVADLIRRTNGRLVPAAVDVAGVSAAARRVVHQARA